MILEKRADGRPLLFGEDKTKSPHGCQAVPSELERDEWERRLEIVKQFSDVAVVHTLERFGGSLGRLVEAWEVVEQPLMAKGFHGNNRLVKQALNHGADLVLIVGDDPSLKYFEQSVFEPLTLAGLVRLPEDAMVVWNSKYPLSGLPKPASESFDVARAIWGGEKLIQASLIRHPSEIHPHAYGAIVGTHLPGFVRHWPLRLGE